MILRSLKASIEDIGGRLVSCDKRDKRCEGIVNEPRIGILPRCLILEDGGRTSGTGCVVVGLNPGHAKPHERDAYKGDHTYKNVVKYWRDGKISERAYYGRLRNFVNELGLRGPILWTELVKCESIEGTTLPLQTLRTCIRDYLNEELKLIPDDWPIVAAGLEAYKASAYRFPDRIIIGVPHPTGSHGQFMKLLDNRLMPNLVASSLRELWDGEIGRAVWVDTTKGELV